MQVQLNTDKNIHGDESLAAWVEGELKDKLRRFGDHLTRVEVHLSDVNASRSSGQDKRCKLEARVAGRQPVAVSHDADKTAAAVHGAIDKLLRLLDTELGRVRDAQGRDTLRGMG
jgi:ribosome-associated translation inhibitor RaiA